MTLFVPLAMHAQTLLVHDGTGTNRYVPFYGYYADEDQQNQMIYPATELTAMNGNAITQMVFYYSSTGSYGSGVGTWTVSLGETTATTLDGLDETTVLTTVFTGGLDALFNTTDKTLTIAFNNEYTYNGGNLLVEFSHSAGSYKDYYFYGETVTGASYCYAYQRNFLPKTTFSYEAPASCPRPTLGEAQNITEEGASFQWTENGSATEWVLQYSTTSDFTNATSLNRSGIPALAISGLSSATTYYVRLKSVCGPGDESDWSNIVSFVTKQTAVAVGNGWSDDFEGAVNWIMVNGGNNAWVIGTAVNNGGDKAMYVSNDGGTTNAYTNSDLNIVYATKLMTFETGQYIFTYDWQANGESNYDYIRAWLAPSTFTFTANQLPDNHASYMSGWTDYTPEGWIALDGGSKLNGVTAWQEGQTATVDVTAGNYYVVFMWGNDGSGGTNPPAAIDNFEIAKVACAAPSALAATDVTAHTATLGWTSDGSAWQVAYTDDAEAEPDDLRPEAVTANSYQLTGLTAETTYYAYVRTDCGGTYSAWTSTYFTTTVACPAPTGLEVALTPGNGSVAALAWTENGTADAWVVEYGTAADFTGATTVNVTERPTTQLTGLTPETTYYARVKTNCGEVDGYSTYSNVVNFVPTDALRITVNDGTSTNSYVPVYGLYVDEFSKSQFIIPATSISGMTNHVIDKLTFYASQESVNWDDAEFEVYFAEVDYTAFEAATLVDWASMTKVMSAGSLGVSGNQMVVELDPYIYNGGNLLIGVLQTTSGTFKSSSWYGVTQTTNTAIGGYESSKAVSLYQYLPKVTFDFSEVPSCFKPNSLAVDDITARTANLTWVAGAEETAWQVCINGDETNPIDVTRTAYLMEELTPNTTYTVKVRANCGEGDFSDWTSEISFTTEPSCYAPTDLAASDLTPVSAKISWTSENENIEMHYRELTDPNNDFDASSLKNWKSIDADGDGYGWVVGAEAPGIYHNTTAVVTGNGHNGSHDFVISGSYSNATGAALTPDNYLVSPQINLGGSITFWAQAQDASWPSEHFGVAVSTTGNAASDFTTIQEWTMTAKGTGAKANPGTTRSGNRDTGNWYEYTVDLSDYAGETGYVAIRHFDCTDQFLLNVDDITIVQPNYVEPEWIDVDNVTNPYTLAGLQPETCYEVEVRANCGTEDGYSSWTWAWFLTPSACDAPTDLVATALVEEATLTWTGYQEIFNVQYRPTSSRETYFFDNFNDGDAEGWTQNDGGVYYFSGDATNWFVLLGYTSTDTQYLISPELSGYESGSTVEFYYRINGTETTFQVGYSSTTSDLTAFTWDSEITASSNAWTLFSETLPTDTKYVAIQTTGTAFLVDDFGIYGATIVYEWETVPEVTSPYELTGLDAGTEYEWQVQGINRSCDEGVTEWSEISTFTTHDYCDDPIDLEAEITGTTATLSWTGYQDRFNLQYRTGEDFADIEFIDLANEQGDWTTYNLEEENYDEWASGWDMLTGYFTFVYTENPPQYLISPELDLQYTNSTLRFEYITLGGETYPETFKVGFSSTTNDITSFTWGDEITATNDEEFEIYTVAVPNDAVYFAIQCTSDDMYALILDNFVVCGTYITPGEWVDVPNPTSPVTLSGLNAETYYDWRVQGVSADCEDGTTDWVSSYFFTDAFNETLELATGWNWVSFYVETEDQDPITLLQMLEDALGDNAVQIQASDIYTEYDGEGGWWGDLDEMGITPDQTYWIQTNSDVTVVLEGMPVNTAEVEITINPGWNWIGFPSAVEMDINDALIDFVAEDGDQFQASDSYSEYVDGEWWGDVENLIPGQGYWYLSYSDDVKTLVYNTGAKAKRGGIFAQLKNNSIDRKNVSLKNKMAIHPMLKSAKLAAKKIILKK